MPVLGDILNKIINNITSFRVLGLKKFNKITYFHLIAWGINRTKSNKLKLYL